MAADKVEAVAAAASPMPQADLPETAPAAAATAAHPEKTTDTATATAATAAAAAAGSAAAAVGENGAGQEETAAAAAATAAAEEEEEMAVFITVHPPLIPTTTGAAAAPPLVLEPLAGMELVMQVRQLLAEIPQTCLYSAFRLVAVTPKGDGDGGKDGDGKEGDKGEDGGDDDVWQGPGDVMNDFVELRSIPAIIARPHKVEVRMELESYTVHTARQHVNKFRELLRYPPPCPDGIGPGVRRGAGSGGKKGKGKSGGGGKNKKSAKEKDMAAAGSASSPAAPAAATTKNDKEGGAAAGAAAADGTVAKAEDEVDPAAEAAAERIKRALDIRGRIKDAKMPVVGTEGLGAFYGVGLGLAVEEVATPSPSSSSKSAEDGGPGGKGGGGGDKDKDGPVTCLKGISVSAWNPPPPQRRMVGDLMYLEVVALDGTVIHVTCTQGGFYVNGSGRGTFDPKPIAGNPCHSHELAVCLLARNPSFAKAWNNAVRQAWRRIQSDDPVHALQRAMREGRGDAVMVKPQWNMPVPDPRWAEHKADPSRAQDDLSSGFGMEDRGVPREWNDEYQCLLELPNDTPDLSMTRSRALHKLLCDFQEAATAGAVAISDGFIPPANPTEVEHSHVFVFNNIFFSFAADSPDAYKAVSGEAAARKSASQDLASVVALNLLGEAFHPQLSIKTLATAVVDFSGRRLIAQSLVPGILNGDQTNKVVYGAMEHGQPLRHNDKVASLLKDVGQRLMIAEREVDAVPIKKTEPGSTPPASTSTPEASAAAATEESATEGTPDPSTVKITGAVEMKGIVGSDGRSYLLDVSRVTPRDANWVHGEKGTGVYKGYLASQADKPPLAAGEWEELAAGEGEGQGRDLSFESMAVLRPELLTSFTRHKVGEWFRTRNAELRNASEKTSTEPLADKETIPSPSVLAEEASNTITTDAASEDTAATAAEGEKGEAEAGEGAVAVGGEGEGGEAKTTAEEEAAAMKGLRMSDEELAKLKEEQEERCKELAMNVNVFMPYKGCVDDEQLLADESLAREAATHLWDVALPFVTAEVKRGSLQPLDCAELAKVLHGAGVNVRYLGRLATVAVEEEAEDAKVRAEGKLRRWRMPLFWLEMLETEMVARAATHVFNRYMAKSSSRARHAPGKAVQQFLNCLLGGTERPTPTALTSKVGIAANGSKRASGSSSPSSALSPYSSPLSSPTGTARGYGSAGGSWSTEDDFGVVKLTPDGLWRSVSLEVFQRFRHRLELWGAEGEANAEKVGRRHKLPLLRRVCQRLGVRVLSRGYKLDTIDPFALEDVVGVFPVVKSCVPASPAPDAAEALEMAQLHLTSGSGLQTAHDFAHHAASLLLQACDGMHSKYPAALNLQARVMYLGGDADTAVALQLKALAYFEQLEGLDSASVVKCHEQLGQYYMTAGLYDKALAHMRAFCYLVELAAGPNHPELSSAYHNMGRAYQDLGSAIMALRCYQEALERQPGDHMINPRVHHSVAETLEAMGGYTDALKHERLSHAGFKAVHGDQYPLVTKSTQNIRALTTKIVKAAQQDQHTSILAAAKQASSAAASASADQPPPAPAAAAKGGAGKKGGSVSAPAAEPVAAAGAGGVEESKVNGPTGGSGQGGGNKSSKKKTKGSAR